MEAEGEKEEEAEGEKEEELLQQTDCQDLPMMQWEELSLRIAELEQQEQERRERPKSGGEAREVTQEEEDLRRCRVSIISSRLSSHKKLQLCFINNSDSEEEEGADRKVTMGTERSGLKQEVTAALRALRDKLLEEQKETEHAAGLSVVSRRKHLEGGELRELSLQQLSGLKTSLQRDVHALSSELVAHLLVRDQLRTKQDAMLLDVQDLT